MTYAIPGQIRTKIITSTSVGGVDSPFTRTRAVLDMMKGWEIMKAVSEGTEYLRENSEAFLPLEPREDYTAYMARVNRAVFSPFTQRLIRAATGLVLRKPITLIGDPYWTEMFKMDVDGCKSDLDELAEKAVLPDGDFGEKVFEQIRVIEPGKYRVFRKTDQIDEMYDLADNSYAGEFDAQTTGEEYKEVESGEFSLGEIPLVTVYSGKTENLVSKPPLLDIAYLNLAHFQRQADLIHSLHVASQPMLVMEGYDDQTKDLAISVNYAMATQPGNKVYYVEPASSAFDAQSAEIKELQMQMATLGISTLSQQKFVAESADARRLDRVDTNSMLAMVSMELEQKLQKAFNLSAQYVGIEPPEVKISRDFDIERLIGQDITALTSLFDQQVIDREEFRDILVQGEVLPSANEAKSE